VRIDLSVDRRVSVERWRRQYSTVYVVNASHVTGIGGSKVCETRSEGCRLK
jgi:hypothetical protein